jgi:iron complex outermembrane receptor protein
MSYTNQLALTGEINKVGEVIMVNVPHSYRLGIELTAGLELFKKLQWNITSTISKNIIKDFTSYIDTYDSTGAFSGQVSEYLGETDLSFSPNFIFGSELTYKPLPSLSLSLISKYIGRQYIDNTSDKSRSLDGYFVNNFSASYSVKIRHLKEIGFNILINNIFNQKYESNAWVYQYYYDQVHYEESGYFPQALINVLIGITIRI